MTDKPITKKDVIERMIKETEVAIMIAEINERFWQRKAILKGTAEEQTLGRVQTELRFHYEFLSFLKEILEEDGKK